MLYYINLVSKYYCGVSPASTLGYFVLLQPYQELNHVDVSLAANKHAFTALFAVNVIWSVRKLGFILITSIYPMYNHDS